MSSCSLKTIDKKSLLVTITIFILGCLLQVMPSVAQSQDTLPSVRMSAGQAITPSEAWNYYTTNETVCSVNGIGCVENLPYDPRVTRLAEALNHDPKNIYDYVKYKVDYTPLFGLLKGSYGTVMDGVGTSFDQAQLMVQLLRESGFTASYEIGDATFSKAEIKAWFGTDNPAALGKILADGGIPATVTGGDTNFATMLHVWVKATIDGQTVYFDPSVKSYEWGNGMSRAQLASSFGINANSIISGAVSGSQNTSSFIKNLNHANVSNTLQNISMAAVGQFSYQQYAGKSASEIIGGRRLPSFTQDTSYQTAYPKAASARATWADDIPSVFKAKFQIDVVSYHSGSLYTKEWSTDEIASRRLGFVYFDITLHNRRAPSTIYLLLDEEEVAPIALDPFQDEFVELDITINHPYASAASNSTVSGSYLDTAETFYMPTYVFSHIAHAWGPVRQNSVVEWEKLELRSLLLKRGYHHSNNNPIPAYVDPSNAGYGIKALVGRRFSALLTQAAELNANIASGQYQHHHSVGLASSDVRFYETNFQIASDELRLSMSTAYSFNSFEDIASEKTNFAFAFSNTTSAVEASTFQQISGKPYAMSVVSMFNWLSKEISENGYYDDALDGFYILDPTDTAARDNVASILKQLHPGTIDPNATTAQLEATLQYGPYLDEGYSVLLPSRRFLGPAENAYQPFLAPPQIERRDGSLRYSGTGFVAFDQSDLTNYAYVIVTRLGAFKGAGSIDISEPATSINVTAEYLDKQYENIYGNFDVDMSDGSLKIDTGVDISTGQGEFPYSLSFNRNYNSNRANRNDLLMFREPYRAPQTSYFNDGWQHNFEIGLNISTNTSVALGQNNDPRAAATAVAVFVALQEMASTGSASERLLTSASIADWWTMQLFNNSYQIFGGGADTHFYRLPNGTFAPQSGSASNLSQIGEPALNRHKWDYAQFGWTSSNGGGTSSSWTVVGCNGTAGDGTPFATQEECETNGGEWGVIRRGLTSVSGSTTIIEDTSIVTWDYLYKDVAFEYETEDGQKLSFGYKQHRRGEYVGEYPESQLNLDYTGEPPRDTLSQGTFLIDKWEFPYDMEVNFLYHSEYVPSGVTITNSIGRQLWIGTENSTQKVKTEDGRYISTSGGSVTKIVDGVSQTTTFPTFFEDSNFDYFDYVTVFQPSGSNVGHHIRAKPRPISGLLLPLDAEPSFKFAYDEFGAVKSITNKDDVSSQYAIHQGAATTTDPLGTNSSSLYDSEGRMAKAIDPLGNVSVSEFDWLGRVSKSKSYTYDDLVHHDGAVTYEYDGKHNVILTAQHPKELSSEEIICQGAAFAGPVGQKSRETFAYEATNGICVEPANVREVTYNYFTSGNGNTMLESWSGPLGTYQSYTYNSIGRPTLASEKVNASEFFESAYAYNAQGFMTGVTIDPNNLMIKSEFLAYNGAGDPTQVKSANGHIADISYDSLRRINATLAPAINGVRSEQKVDFDLNGRVTDVHALSDVLNDGTKVWASTQYDYLPNGRLEKITDADGYITRTVYDIKGRPFLTVDAENRKTYTVYDALDRPVKVIKAWQGNADGTGGSESCEVPGSLQQCYQQYTYKPNGQVETVTDANGSVTTYAYDGFDRLATTTFPDGSYEGYTYDEDSNMEMKLTRKGEMIYYYYDALNRLIGKTVPFSGTAFTINVPEIGSTLVTHAFEYDLLGRMTSATHDGETITMEYDSAGRLEFKEHNGTNKVAYEYDQAGNVTRLIYPDGWGVDFAYDALNRVTTAEESLGVIDGTTNPSVHAGRLLASVSYDALSRRQSVTYGNGASQSYDFTARGDLNQIAFDFAGADAPQILPSGQVMHSVQMDFAFNGVGQLLSEEVNRQDLLWQHTGIDEFKKYAVNDLNQYTSIDAFNNEMSTVVPMANHAPQHDMNGNLTSDGKGRTFTYDAENVLRSVNDNGTLMASYAYGADATRRTKTVYGASASVTSQFWYDELIISLGAENILIKQEIMETDANGNTLRRYVRLPGSVDEVILMLDYQAAANEIDPVEVWTHVNRLGSTIMTSDEIGEISEIFTYSPYGLSGTSTTGIPFRYTGQKLDAETGLYYYKARYYDPEEGRFLQTDPIGYVDQMNMYAYVGNDPKNWIDPLGTDRMICESVDGAKANCTLYRDSSAYVTLVLIKINSKTRTRHVSGPTTTRIPSGLSKKYSKSAAEDAFNIKIKKVEVVNKKQTKEIDLLNKMIGNGTVGTNARRQGKRLNTDMRGGEKAAAQVFNRYKSGAVTTQRGGQKVAENGVRLRNTGNGWRVDIPKGQGIANAAETIHFY